MFWVTRAGSSVLGIILAQMLMEVTKRLTKMNQRLTNMTQEAHQSYPGAGMDPEISNGWTITNQASTYPQVS